MLVTAHWARPLPDLGMRCVGSTSVQTAWLRQSFLMFPHSRPPNRRPFVFFCFPGAQFRVFFPLLGIIYSVGNSMAGRTACLLAMSAGACLKTLCWYVGPGLGCFLCLPALSDDVLYCMDVGRGPQDCVPSQPCTHARTLRRPSAILQRSRSNDCQPVSVWSYLSADPPRWTSVLSVL